VLASTVYFISQTTWLTVPNWAPETILQVSLNLASNGSHYHSRNSSLARPLLTLTHFNCQLLPLHHSVDRTCQEVGQFMDHIKQIIRDGGIPLLQLQYTARGQVEFRLLPPLGSAHKRNTHVNLGDLSILPLRTAAFMRKPSAQVMILLVSGGEVTCTNE
jgi:hypothetical protein